MAGERKADALMRRLLLLLLRTRSQLRLSRRICSVLLASLAPSAFASSSCVYIVCLRQCSDAAAALLASLPAAAAARDAGERLYLPSSACMSLCVCMCAPLLSIALAMRVRARAHGSQREREREREMRKGKRACFARVCE